MPKNTYGNNKKTWFNVKSEDACFNAENTKVGKNDSK